MVPPRTRRRVLVVDDSEGARLAVALLLEGEGYRVGTACDGQQALDLLRGGDRPDVIVLDLVMPKMDGWYFREAQLRDPAIAHIPVVVFSAAREAELGLGKLGDVLFVQKPGDPDELFRAIDHPPGGAGAEPQT